MFKNSIDFTRLIHTVINRTSILSLLTLLFVGGVHTQTLPPGNKTSVAGWTPLAEQPGAPAGSYALSGFDNVNLFNGHLNFRLPLIHIGGRGSAGYTMTLPIEQHWMVQTVAAPHCDQSSCIYNPSDYRYIANPTWWTGIQPGYGPGVLQGRQTGDYLQSVQGCGSGVVFHYTLTRLTFTAPDGTEFELRDAATNGQPTTGGPPGCFEGFNRGKVFVTADGSAATFVSDTDIKDYRQPPSGAATLIYPSGYMMLRDGIRYRIVNGQVTWTRDTNGNQIRFTYSGGTLIGIDDSLNRHVSISYSDINYPSNPDVITFKGAGGATRTIKIYHALQSTVLRKHPDGSTEYTIKTFQELYPQLQNPQQGNCDLSVVSAVELPDGRQYQFRYNSYANLAQVILPTGGRFEYDWTNGTYNQGDYVWGTWERVLERRTAVDATTPIYETRMTYSIPSSGVVTVDTLDPKNGNALLARSKHYFAGPWLPSLLAKGTDYPAWQDGREYQTEEYDANGTTLLRRINHIWQQRAPVSWWTGGADGAPPNDPRLVESTTTLVDTNQVAKSSAINPIDGSVGFDLYNNQTDLWEYDYGNGVAGSLIRHTHTTFVTAGYDTLNPSSSSPNVSVTYHIRNLPSEVSVYDAAGVKRARTVFEYDNYAIDSNHNGLLARTDISGLDSAFTSSYVARGNVTGKTAYLLNTSGVEIGSISAYSQYDLAGNVVKIIDGRGYATVLDYADRFGTAADDEARSNSIPAELSSQSQTSYAFPTKVTNALGHEFYTQFDYYLGEAVNVEDANGIVSSRYCEDLLDRPTKLVVASNQSISGSPKAQTLFVYDDVNHTITRKSDQNSFADQNPLRTESLYDGLGRTIESRQYETASSFIAVQTQHDGAGRAYKVSSPFRADETILWTTTAFDALGRPISVTTPDSAVVSTSYSGNTVTVTDQAGKKRKSLTDALGRLTDVFEDPTPGLNYQTTYAYDVLDNLKTVIQGTQTRTFVYDSLKRLKSATNPESGTITYDYDNNSNLTQKTDARGIVSTYAYDALNRNTTIDYSDTTSINPDVSRFYDGATNGKGRLWYSYADGNESVGNNVEKTLFDSYDALGRPLVLRQLFKLNGVWSSAYQVSRFYNRAGGLSSQTYPSGHTVTYNYDAAGRLADNGANLAFTGNLGDGVLRTYARGISYVSSGAMKQEQFGTTTPIYNKLFYNSRLQLAEILTSTTGDDSSWNRGKIINDYSLQCSGTGCNATDNNGNLRKQEVYIPANDQVSSYTSWSQQYDYDALNRLKRVQEYTPSLAWQQEYDYDQWGNRTINQVNTWGNNIPKPNFGVNTANNRLTAPAGYSMSYDTAGNLTTDAYTGYGNRTYDAENKMTAAQDSYAGWSYYTYNADGQRTRRKINNQETWQIYGIDGELLAEYPANGSVSSPQKEYGYRNGQLLVTASGASRVNFASSTNGGTATAQNYTQDGVYPGYHFYPSSAIDGQRYGHLIAGGGDIDGFWRDEHGLPSWLQVDFNGTKTIDEVDVFTVPECPACLNQSDPSPTQTFSQYGATAFDVQYWSGSSWVTVTGGSITGNNLVWRKINFAPITTSKIRVVVNAAATDGVARIAEVEAWGSSAPTNVALTTNGATVSAQNYTQDGVYPGYHFYPSSAIDGQRYGHLIAGGDDINGFWRDEHGLPSWLQVDFNGTKTIEEVDVFTVPECPACLNQSDPSPTQTFSQYGATAFDVQYWSGSSWVTVPGGSITGNNLVWRKINFAPITTSKIRVVVNSAATDGVARIAEVEAWTGSTGSTTSNIQWLVTDHLGTPRMILDQTGNLASVKRHDYLPFGEELSAPTGLRASALGYSVGDGVRQQFTQKERDIETGLDYFLARYYSSVQGRFTSPDEFKGGPEELFGDVDPHDPLFYADTAEPQSLNKYHYALNNPLRYIDPDGHQTTTADKIKQGVADFITGVGRGITSSLTLGASGAPREDDSLTNRAGQGVGTVVTAVAGYAMFQAGGGVTVLSGGSAAEVSVPLAVGGVVTVAEATVNAVKIAATPIQRNSTSDDRTGKDFTKKGKETVIEQNKDQNKGQTKCSNCGTDTVPGQQGRKGVSKPANETQVDHIIPKSRGGQGRPDNGRVLCRKCNQEKSNKMPE